MVTFSKRKSGLFKKAFELSILCGIQIVIILFSHGGNPFSFGNPSVETVANRFLYQNEDDQDDVGEPSQNNEVYQLNQQVEELKNQFQVAKEKGDVLSNGVKNKDPLGKDHAPNLEELQKMKASLKELGGYMKVKINNMDLEAATTLLELANQDMF
ncbi:agamous-like MADS-box protein AGL29 [Lotus japonicus]|uniref:agamous-like MADS-box protein AGL29 n=1 Tax=Lotus japonicus TaxID=34305 RepID=UPI002588362B|nr:agamous-like MADS-box protein AGL29 [Lotus japonicus]